MDAGSSSSPSSSSPSSPLLFGSSSSAGASAAGVLDEQLAAAAGGDSQPPRGSKKRVRGLGRTKQEGDQQEDTSRGGFTCQRCFKAKIKCDRGEPCERCARLGYDCEPHRVRRGRPSSKLQQSPSSSSSSSSHKKGAGLKENPAAAKTKQARSSNDSTATLPQVERRNGQACDDDDDDDEEESVASSPLGPAMLDEEAALWEQLDSLHTASTGSPSATTSPRSDGSPMAASFTFTCTSSSSSISHPSQQQAPHGSSMAMHSPMLQVPYFSFGPPATILAASPPALGGTPVMPAYQLPPQQQQHQAPHEENEGGEECGDDDMMMMMEDEQEDEQEGESGHDDDSQQQQQQQASGHEEEESEEEKWPRAAAAASSQHQQQQQQRARLLLGGRQQCSNHDAAQQQQRRGTAAAPSFVMPVGAAAVASPMQPQQPPLQVIRLALHQQTGELPPFPLVAGGDLTPAACQLLPACLSAGIQRGVYHRERAHAIVLSWQRQLLMQGGSEVMSRFIAYFSESLGLQLPYLPDAASDEAGGHVVSAKLQDILSSVRPEQAVCCVFWWKGPNGSLQPNVAVSERFLALFGSLEGPISDGEPAMHLWSRFVDAGSQEAYWRLVVDSVLLKTNLSGCQVISVHDRFGLRSWVMCRIESHASSCGSYSFSSILLDPIR